MTPWVLSTESSPHWRKAFKQYDKKHPDELAAVLHNLDRFLLQLNSSPNPGCIQAGYLHKEPQGIMAVDQKGKKPYLQETRLYTYPQEAQQVLHLITIGNKNSQSSDIKNCLKFLNSLTSS